MKFAKGSMLLVALLFCLTGTVLAADRVVLGEMFTNTS